MARDARRHGREDADRRAREAGGEVHRGRPLHGDVRGRRRRHRPPGPHAPPRGARQARDRDRRTPVLAVRAALGRRRDGEGVPREAAGRGRVDQRRLLRLRAEGPRPHRFRPGLPRERASGEADEDGPARGLCASRLLAVHGHVPRDADPESALGDGTCSVGEVALNREFWKGRRVFVTGHTGFKGGWLATWLHDLGSEVAGFALEPDTTPSFFRLCGLDRLVRSTLGDVRDSGVLDEALRQARPEIVFHLAAQALVRRSLRDPAGTFSTNVMGTAHLLDAVARVPGVRAVVVVTSDKCYEPRSLGRGFKEDDPLGGADPYSASKACAELVTAAYRRCILPTTGVATARAGNVIGGGDWSEDRLVPDAVRALQRGETLRLRNPHAVRPWQHVLEPLHGYLMLAEKLFGGEDRWSGGWNFGPDERSGVTVASLADLLVQCWGGGRWEAQPDPLAHHETQTLVLDATKAAQLLGWRPRLSLEESVRLTVEWYRKAAAGGMLDFTRSQIREYESRGGA
ncbi:MAG: CDP-glucose 4,6-dehydratase [Planctomycetes bacterium]|nr:CDP-glucose 4,6-dehydratase [Planctomycetota bacterium]